MAMFLLGNEFTAEQKRRNFEYYDPITTGRLVAVGEHPEHRRLRDRRGGRRLPTTSTIALLMDLADVAGNVSDGVHIASAAGALDGARVRLRRRPRLRRPAHHRPSPARSGSARSGSRLRFHDRQLRVQSDPRRGVVPTRRGRAARDRRARPVAPPRRRRSGDRICAAVGPTRTRRRFEPPLTSTARRRRERTTSVSSTSMTASQCGASTIASRIVANVGRLWSGISDPGVPLVAYGRLMVRR